MVQVAIGASYSVLKTTTSQIPAFLSARHQISEPVGSPQPLTGLSWPMSSLWFSTSNVCLRLEPFSWQPSLLSWLPLLSSSIPWSRLRHTKPLQELSGNPLPVSNFSLTSHLFFLLAPRQHWDQIQAPLSCNRDKMACVVLGFCDCRWISFLGSPNLLLGPVLIANPAGFVYPVCSTQLYLTGVVLSYPTMNCTPMSIRAYERTLV